MRIGPAANVARINVNEIITAFWIIGGVGLRNTAIDLLGLGSPANRILGSDFDGDAEERFRLHAGGIMQWGDGAGARDTELRREAANELGTPDSFNVGGVLDLAGDMEISEQDIVLAVGDNNDVDSGTVTAQLVSVSGGLGVITGFAGGRAGRLIAVFNVDDTDIVNLTHEAAGSDAVNRLILPGEVTQVLNLGEALWMFYDITSLRWRALNLL